MNLTSKNIAPAQIYQLKLTDKEFARLSEFIGHNFGIKMMPVKRVMLQSRLYKRLKALNMNSFGEYLDYLFSKVGMERELIQMVNVVSTNKTDFFREPVHFDFIQRQLLPGLDAGQFRNHPFRIWSAGCSSGEEPYTIAMIMEDFRENNPGFQYQILGTDISTDVLDKASSAIYTQEKIGPVPLNYKKKYLLKSKDESAGLIKIAPVLREKVSFRRLNFMDSTFNINERFDIIFCRNVLIYFDHERQENVIQKLCLNLRPGGIFFLGHSESITRMDVPLKHIKPTVFKKI